MRTLMQLNNNWLFSLTATGVPASLPADWQSVNLPHTWNGIDGQDGEKKQKSNGSGIKLNSTILEMAKGFTVKRILSMVSLMGQETPSKEEMLAINKKLNKIKKK